MGSASIVERAGGQRWKFFEDHRRHRWPRRRGGGPGEPSVGCVGNVMGRVCATTRDLTRDRTLTAGLLNRVLVALARVAASVDVGCPRLGLRRPSSALSVFRDALIGGFQGTDYAVSAPATRPYSGRGVQPSLKVLGALPALDIGVVAVKSGQVVPSEVPSRDDRPGRCSSGRPKNISEAPIGQRTSFQRPDFSAVEGGGCCYRAPQGPRTTLLLSSDGALRGGGRVALVRGVVIRSYWS